MSPEEIRKRLRYDPETGRCYWVDPSKYHRGLTGQEAGCSAEYRGKTRWYIRLGGRGYPRARIAFAIMTGKFPEMVDHKNGNTLDDRWANLREASASQNAWNIGGRTKKSELPVGVRALSSGRFQARIAANRETRMLGTFATAAEAYAAYLRAKAELHGEFQGRLA